MTLAVPEINQPSMTVKELVTFIQQLEMNQERTLQTSIGPSEIGLPCSRRLIKKLLNTKDPQQDSRWLATVGTAVHAWLAQGFEAPEHRRGYLNGRFGDVLVEERVNVGTIGGVEIWGSADLFDILTGLVVDWKVVGNSRLDAYRRYGPGQQYRVQAHLYGRGFARLGLPVRNVLIMKPGVYGSITIALEPPDSETGSPVVDDVMLRVADFLEVHGVSSKTQIELNVRGNVPDIRRAARDLVQQGFVATEPGPRNALLHRLVRTPRPTPSHPVHVQPAHHVPLSIDRDVLGDRSFQLPMVEVELPDPADDPSAEG